ncbi:hypothetical protein C8R43DRAFT_1015194 [Mycena crocata]|nr:hypothetical protein C8R43DRAFT_1015194 [Mycena crocata]
MSAVDFLSMGASVLSFSVGSAPAAFERVDKHWDIFKTPGQLENKAAEKMKKVLEIINKYGAEIHVAELAYLQTEYWEYRNSRTQAEKQKRNMSTWDKLSNLSQAREEAQNLLNHTALVENFAQVASDKAMLRKDFIPTGDKTASKISLAWPEEYRLPQRGVGLDQIFARMGATVE